MDIFKTDKLKNGLRLLTIKNKDNDIIILNIKINLGWDLETKDNLEVAHFFEHLFCGFTSSKYNDSKKNRREMSLKSIEVDAETSSKYILFSLEFKKKYCDYVFDMLIHSLLDFKVDTNIFKQEKNAVIEELNDLIKDSDYNFNKKIDAIIFKDHGRGYSQEERLQNTKKMTEEMILKYFKKYFNSNNIIIGIHGNLEKKLLDKFKVQLNKIKKGELIKYKSFKLNFDIPIIYYKKNSNVSNLKILFKVNSNIFHECNYIINTLIYILVNDQFNSLIMDKLRTEEGLVYYCYCNNNLDEIDNNISYISINTLCRTNNILKVIKYIFEILNHVKNNLINKNLLNSYKENNKMSYLKLLANHNPNELLKCYLNYYLWNKKIISISNDYKNYNYVTLHQLKSISNKIFNKNNMVICYDGRKKLDKEIETLSKIIDLSI